MKIVAISDSHGQHSSLKLPDGDLLLHAGDISSGGTRDQVLSFLDWFAQQDYEHKILIAGNHDFFFERASVQEIEELIPEGIIYLDDSGVEIAGVKFWGSPVSPWFHNWAFNRNRGTEIKRHWDLIPEHTDVLITHGPPYGILDETVYRDVVGCEDLMLRVHQVNPQFHVFGHIHEAYGQLTKDGTTFINASVLDDQYELMHAAVVFEIS